MAAPSQETLDKNRTMIEVLDMMTDGAVMELIHSRQTPERRAVGERFYALIHENMSTLVENEDDANLVAELLAGVTVLCGYDPHFNPDDARTCRELANALELAMK